MKRLFTAIERGQVNNFKPAGRAGGFRRGTDPRFEKATEEFLHEELEYVVVKDWADAERGVELMRADLDGRATFLVHPECGRSARRAQHLSNADGIIGPLRDLLRFTNGLTNAPPAMLPRLAQLLPGRGSRTRAAAGRANTRMYSSCCPTASAITATRSAAARRLAAVHWR